MKTKYHLQPITFLPVLLACILGTTIATAIAGQSRHIVYDSPTKFIDEETDFAFVDRVEEQEGVLMFTHATALIQSLQPGDILMADPSVVGYHPQDRPYGFELRRPYLAHSIPFRYERQEDGGLFHHLIGEIVTYEDIVESGIFSDDSEAFYDPELENTLTRKETEDRLESCEFAQDEPDPNKPPSPFEGKEDFFCSMKAIPIRFNNLPVHEHAYISGEVLFRSANFDLEITKENSVVDKVTAVVEMEFTVAATLETDADVTIPPTALEIRDVRLPNTELDLLGVPYKLKPRLMISLGAEGTLPANSKLPIFVKRAHRDSL